MAELIGSNNNGDAVLGTSQDGGAGVRGIANGSNHDGVVGQSSTSGNGVAGFATNGQGIYGQSPNGDGVYGETSNGDGVAGVSEDGGAGVRGTANGDNHDGVVGQSNNTGNGVLGVAANGAGVFAVSMGGGHGVSASAAAGDGVNGTSQGGGSGVSGLASYGDGTQIGNGVDGLVASGAGVLGTSTSASVIGLVNPGGWHPETGLPNSQYSIGVCGAFSSTQDQAPLPWDIPFTNALVAQQYNHYGVYGMANVGVMAATPFHGGYGLLACNTAAGGYSAAFSGSVQITGNIELSGQVLPSGQDCAECFDVADGCEAGPGCVMTMNSDGRLVVSSQAYDKRVAGIVSGGGDSRPGIVLGTTGPGNDRQAPIALAGRVMCKVDASYAPIEVGDLLTSSPTRGHAMKATEAARSLGSVIGKALRPLRQGQDLIPVLVTLQ